MPYMVKVLRVNTLKPLKLLAYELEIVCTMKAQLKKKIL